MSLTRRRMTVKNSFDFFFWIYDDDGFQLMTDFFYYYLLDLKRQGLL